MRVVLITGSYPPESCGVGDYVHCLARALQDAGADVSVHYSHEWGIGAVLSAAAQPHPPGTIFHLQYPTMGYGHSLGPHILSILRRCVITLHEFSAAHFLRQVSTTLFSVRSHKVVVTSEVERRELLKAMPWLSGKTEVIPIGSNITAEFARREDRKKAIAYFGLIAPLKGIEEFIQLASYVQQQKVPLSLKIIGRIPPQQKSYARKLLHASRCLPLEWCLECSDKEVSQLLSEISLAYLPFPDGASERRGSLKAMLAAGIPSLTRISRLTPPDLTEVVVPVSCPREALQKAIHVCSNSDVWEAYSRKSLQYSEQFSWGRIANSHILLYRTIHA